MGLEGALALREFGLALFIGLIVGAYSSIFVATPLLVWWKEREPRYRALAERSSVRATRDAAAAMSTTFDEDEADREAAEDRRRPPAATTPDRRPAGAGRACPARRARSGHPAPAPPAAVPQAQVGPPPGEPERAHRPCDNGRMHRARARSR